jgi:hypothetical protein
LRTYSVIVPGEPAFWTAYEKSIKPSPNPYGHPGSLTPAIRSIAALQKLEKGLELRDLVQNGCEMTYEITPPLLSFLPSLRKTGEPFA